jgi:SNF2 family DNA or RNA helicase
VLDGQPVAEGADELYSQFKFLDPWIIGHDTWTGFKAEFCEIGYWNEIKGYKNLDELHRRIDGYCYRILASECLDLPERIYKRWAFSLSENENRIFDDLKGKDLAFFHTNGTTTLDEVAFYSTPEGKDSGPEYLQESRALVKSLRLQQISSGWWPGEDFRAIDNQPSRLLALLKLLEAVEGKCLIYSRFTADLEAIAGALGSSAVSYHGGVNEDDRAKAKRRFMNDRKIRYFIGQPQTAGIGHTLTAAANVIFYSNSPSLRLREECEKRAHRKGLKHRLLVWDLVAKGTHDEKIVNALRDKKELANEILRDPDEFFLVYE